jgi:heme-degrading monooxygenase HmoA
MSADYLAATPQPPYYAVIFTSQRTDVDDGYDRTAMRMIELAETMPGFLGVESARSGDKLGITVSYWRDEEAIRAWREHAEHRLAQDKGKAVWYEDYFLRIAKVERAYRLKK